MLRSSPSQPLTWLWHRPLFALKQAAGNRQLANTCQVGRPGAELIEVAFTKVTDLEKQKHRLKAEPREEGDEVQQQGRGSGQEVHAGFKQEWTSGSALAS